MRRIRSKPCPPTTHDHCATRTTHDRSATRATHDRCATPTTHDGCGPRATRTTHDRCATRTTHDRCATGNRICVRSVNRHDSQKRGEAESSEYRQTHCCLPGWVNRIKPRSKTLFATGAATRSGMLSAIRASVSKAFLELSSHTFQNVRSRTYSVNSPSPIAFPLATRFRS
jgi:hypothetical protein